MITYPGRYFDLDEDGYIINPSHYSKITKNYLPLINDVITKSKEYFINRDFSLYLRGSVSTGLAVPNHSDADFVIILYGEKRNEDSLWGNEVARNGEITYPFIPLIDITIVTHEELLSDEWRNLFVNITVCSINLLGKDILVNTPPLKPGGELSKFLYHNIEDELIDLKNLFYSDNLEKRIYQNRVMPTEFWCRWTMRALLRSTISITMYHKPVFSNDVRTCYYEFIKIYPEYKNDLFQALNWEWYPTNNKKEILDFLDELLPKYFSIWNNLS